MHELLFPIPIKCCKNNNVNYYNMYIKKNQLLK